MVPLKTRGKAINIEDHIVGRVTKNINLNSSDYILLFDGEKVPQGGNYLAYVTTSKMFQINDNEKVVYGVANFNHLVENDIICLGNDGVINTLYRIDSQQNTLLATERCNSNCLMCSQPPRDRNDIPRLFDIHTKLIPLIPKDCIELGISGGEPTLMGDLFFKQIEQLKAELPNTELHLLTNGRTFAWNKMAQKLGTINHSGLMLGIPLYSDDYLVHDHIVQAENAFYQTVLGIQNLFRYNQRIEIRVVLHKLSVERLFNLSEFIYKNMPYVEHVAFMGLEYIGYTPFNIDKLWIDPVEYMDELKKSVEYLSSRGMQVSIFNTPLCLIQKDVWKFARKSISDWKNDFADVCETCQVKNDCCGFFSWNLEKKMSSYIKPIILETNE